MKNNNSKSKQEDKDLFILRNEIILSEKIIQDKVAPKINEVIKRYKGEYVSPYELELELNEIYPIIQYEIPSIFFKSPRAFLKPRQKTYITKKTDPITGKKVEVTVDANKSAKTQEHILNYSIELMKYKNQMRKTTLDALLFPYGALWHGYKGEFGMTEEASIYIENEKVFVSHLTPTRILFDPKVTLSNIDEAEWVGRSFDIPLRDLVEDDTLYIEKGLKGKEGFGAILDGDNPMLNKQGENKLSSYSRAKKLLDYAEEGFREHSHYVTVYEIFKRPTRAQKRKGEKGNVYLLTNEQEKPLRKNTWPYKTRGWPLKILFFNEVPQNIFPMADIDVFGPIADHKNMIINLQLRNAESNSKVMTGFDKEGLDEEEIQKIQNGEQNIIGFNGSPQGKLAVFSPGGSASSELYLIDGRIQANLDEKSGVTDLKKGFLRSGEESATSVQIRNAGSSSRPAYRQDIMSDFLKDSFKFINDLNQQFMPIKEAVRISGTLDIEWSEKPSKEEIQADVDVEIDVISMLPESPEKEIKDNQLILSLMTDALNNPAILQKLQEEGKKFNISPIIEQLLYRMKIRDPEAFRGIRPEESMGVASVAELRAAQANVEAIMSGSQIPSPPQEGQQHNTRIETYVAAQRILQLEGKVNEILEQLILVQNTIAEQESQTKQPRTLSLKKPSVNTGVV